MSGKGRSYSIRDLKVLFATSQNRCSFPDCGAMIVDGNDVVMGEVCHIEGLNKTSARYNAKLPIQDRRKEANLMLMCQPHHTLVDAQRDIYTAEVLRRIKEKAKQTGVVEITPRDAKFAESMLQVLRYMSAAGKKENVYRPVFNAKVGAAIIGNGNTTTIHNVKKIYTGKRKNPAASPESGEIGHSAVERFYIKYLYDQAIDFIAKMYHKKNKHCLEDAQARAGVKLSKKVREAYGTSAWSHVPIAFFCSLVALLQETIDNTPIGRKNTKNCWSNYDTFDEWKRAREAKRKPFPF